jgi:hypothetical protein
MRSQFALALFSCLLLGCRGAATTAPLTGSAATAASAAQLFAATQLAAATQAAAAPTPTSFADGLVTRLGTPDPSPNCPNHNPWFFINPAQECAATVLNTWAAYEPFEHGVMVWIAEGGHTYVLLDDGSPFKPYQEVVDLQGLPLPDPDPSLVPPSGMVQPVLGFGKFWRGLVPGSDWVRQRLGWATAPETGYSALWQCNTAAGDAARCYFTGPRDEVVVMTRGSAQYWAFWQGPAR